ncbi:unnamed protein product [Sphagnum jensenii]|uniref:Protein phosphatase n=1 Tax=Sphagnum jensenii TaxID=128206 RepID=A0ABP1AAI9_9BRYO
MSNVLGCRSTMAAMGGRVAVLGSRGLLQWQRQCSVAAVGAMGSILQLAIQRRLPNLQWPKDAPYFSRLLQESHQRLSLFPLQCALQDASLPSTKLLLFNSNDHLAEEVNDKDNVLQKAVDSNGAATPSSPTGGDNSGFSEFGMQEGNQDNVSLNSAAAMIPHPDKAQTGGEDAFFIEGMHWVGVADGVGGWALSGVNAGHYARELMWNCAEFARKGEDNFDPKSVLVKAAGQTKSTGTAAAVIASVYDQTLRVANIGDSGFVVVRDSAIVARSKPMVRGFNFPYQIGTDGDDPALAEVYEFQVTRNDVLVLGSDGIFDNLFDGQIVAVVTAVQKAGGGPEVVAKELVKLAQKVGVRTQGISPFAVAAHGAGYTTYFGGKLDDTTAVVGFLI